MNSIDFICSQLASWLGLNEFHITANVPSGIIVNQIEIEMVWSSEIDCLAALVCLGSMPHNPRYREELLEKSMKDNFLWHGIEDLVLSLDETDYLYLERKWNLAPSIVYNFPEDLSLLVSIAQGWRQKLFFLEGADGSRFKV
ncbi:MAG: type III secretion system chaperone [Deltaproteobacteria bacterium]|jgi:hypothetical protein|nr:type III secretion system chaperone [Deltaproteobacteria bacterium]